MSSKWIKALVLLFIVAVLLTVAGVTTPKNKDNNTAADGASADGSSLTPTDKPGSDLNGWVNTNGASYYYINGILQKNTVVGSDAEGYAYVGANGAKDSGYCNAVTANGVKWNVIEGVATRVNEEDKWAVCLNSALYHVGQCTDSSMTREQKLRAAFDYIKRDDVFLEGELHDEPYREMDWPVVCANDLFVEGMGDCFSYGAAMAFIGKAIGFEDCYACNTGGHGWAEINGKAYDAEWDMHHQEYNHFGVSPEDDCDVAYFTTLTEGVDWMKIKL